LEAPDVAESLAERIAVAFCDCALPHQEWTHEAHLRVGLWHLTRYPADAALARLREGISRYNVACGVANTEGSGYHETITRFHAWMIRGFLRGADLTRTLDELADGLIARHGDGHLPLRYYSRDRLMSPAARLGRVEPDLSPLG
jgi:hypothetical protein